VTAALPIEACRLAFDTAHAAGAVVITSPTGSGKSTAVPRWCAEGGRRVLVVQPRRVACRSLGQRVASLEGSRLGDRVGYAVRDERRACDATQILFVTTGIALRMVRSGDAAGYDVVILDELHERSMDLDLLLALLHGRPGLVTMSATLDGAKVAAHLGGTWVHAEGRTHPVQVRFPANQPPLPDARGIEDRIARVLADAPSEGDVLVFLPGKAEIRSVAERLRGRWRTVQLHGGLSLEQQAEAFETGPERRVVLATNVAETSVTLPGIRVVIDSGLVRRTRYHRGRSVLTLAPVAQDAADQRAGRAGRLAPGVAYRLWSERALLEAHTPPEVYRESLVPLVLAAAACGHPKLDLPFLDPLKDHAVDAAREDLRLLGAIDEDGALTPTGEHLFGMPLDPAMGRLLIEGRDTAEAADVVDLVAALTTPRRLFLARPLNPDDDLRDKGCDATALIRAVREGDPRRHNLDTRTLTDMRRTAQRLRALIRAPEATGPIHREALAQVLLRAWPDAAHVARRRGGGVAWSNGGTELELGRDSAVDPEKATLVIVLDTHAMGSSRLDQTFLATAAMPITTGELLRAGLGRDRLSRPVKEKRTVHAVIERVYAGRVIETRTEVPTGQVARDAVCALFLEGRLFDRRAANHRLESLALWAQLRGEAAPPTLEAWTLARLKALGLESGEEVELLSSGDLLPDPLDPWDQEKLDRDYPRALDIGDAKYRLEYHPHRRLLELIKVGGVRKSLPPLRYVPTLPGWAVEVVDKNVRRTLRGR
jgi:ATP-dependent helicase HrpB